MAYTIVVGEEDAQVLRRLSGRDTIRVVPNGVAVGHWPVWDQEAQVPTVIFTGVMSYWPNIDAVHYFARKIWPDVRAAIPNARFLIAGRSPDPSVTRLGQRPGVEVLADVPDMAAVLRKAWVAVAPMRCGSGIKNKVLEAWAAGKPVVMSKLASNGLRLDTPAARLVAAGPQEMGRLVIGLLSSREERERLGAAGYSLVADRHSWDAAAQQLSTLLDAASGQDGGAT